MAIELRLRAFLTPDEVASLLRAAKKGRHGGVSARAACERSNGTPPIRRRFEARNDLLPPRAELTLEPASSEAGRGGRAGETATTTETANKRLPVSIGASPAIEQKRVLARCGSSGRACEAADEGVCASAATCMRLLLGEQGLRSAANPGLSWAQANSEYGALHNTERSTVCESLVIAHSMSTGRVCRTQATIRILRKI